MDGACRRERAPGRYQPRRPSPRVLYRLRSGIFKTWRAYCRDGTTSTSRAPLQNGALRPIPLFIAIPLRGTRMCRILSEMPVLLAIALTTLLAGCGGADSGSAVAPRPLSADNLNLIFVASPDLTHHADGDVQPDTANLTRQGLQRSLLMATYLQQQVLGNNNVTAIYALSPMTHRQTVRQYPDMTSLGYIQQFALLNQTTQPVALADSPTRLYSANSHPINASYAKDAAPADATPPASACPNCVGLDFNNTNGANDALVSRIVKAPPPNAGYHVFSGPWQTISALMTYLNVSQGYGLDIPRTYKGPNIVYAISISPSGVASLATYDSDLHPSAAYPALPARASRHDRTAGWRVAAH